MKHDKAPSTREEWDEFAGHIQQDVNETLERIGIEIEAGNLALATMTDQAEIAAYSRDIVEFLDSQWGYLGDRFLVTGKWTEPMVAMDDEKLISRLVPQDAFRVAQSNGYNVIPRDGDRPPRIGVSFVVAEAVMLTPSIQGRFQLLAFGEPENLSLQYVRPKEETVVSSDMNEVAESLLRVDSLLHLYLNDARSKFYQFSAKKQEAFLKDMLKSIEDVIPAPESMDKLLLMNAKTPTVHYRNPNGQGVIQVNAESDDNPITITGHVRGFTLADVVNDGYGIKYNRPDDLYASGGGLSFIVEPYTSNLQGTGFEDQDAFVPMRPLGSITLSLE